MISSEGSETIFCDEQENLGTFQKMMLESL